MVFNGSLTIKIIWNNDLNLPQDETDPNLHQTSAQCWDSKRKEIVKFWRRFEYWGAPIIWTYDFLFSIFIFLSFSFFLFCNFCPFFALLFILFSWYCFCHICSLSLIFSSIISLLVFLSFFLPFCILFNCFPSLVFFCFTLDLLLNGMPQTNFLQNLQQQVKI